MCKRSVFILPVGKGLAQRASFGWNQQSSLRIAGIQAFDNQFPSFLEPAFMLWLDSVVRRTTVQDTVQGAVNTGERSKC